MKKNKEWAFIELGKLFPSHAEMYDFPDDITVMKCELLSKVYDILSQLDEPEVLSQDWIDEHSNGASRSLYVWADDLKNLLVPKQEITEEQAWSKIAEYYPVEQIGLKNAFEHFYYGGFMTDAVVEKPSIPQFVADHIENRRGESLAQAYNIPTITKVGKWLLDKENCETFARAWLDGYTVEEEQKYIVVLGKSIYNTTTYGQIGEANSKKIMQSICASKENIITPNQYIKSEILEVKNGEDIFQRYAVKVEELD